ncbi:MAG: FeoB-associated Cys-rich membrane protein [Lachnospiraceae bacterium]|nr:FeoB-associated Cys-rich membrane protein [Lachnospiraceae bacterium]
MGEWFAQNIGTILVAVVLVVLVALVVRRLIKDKKAGKSTCGSNCAHCAMAGKCHQVKKT